MLFLKAFENFNNDHIEIGDIVVNSRKDLKNDTYEILAIGTFNELIEAGYKDQSWQDVYNYDLHKNDGRSFKNSLKTSPTYKLYKWLDDNYKGPWAAMRHLDENEIYINPLYASSEKKGFDPYVIVMKKPNDTLKDVASKTGLLDLD